MLPRRARNVTFLPIAIHTLGMQHLIHRRGAGALVAAVRPGPQFGEPVGVGAPAFEAGPVTGGERRGLVQEEQLGVAIGLHDLAMPALELEHAGDPLSGGPAAGPDGLVGCVEGPAAIAHQQASMRRGDDLALGGDAVLERHAQSAKLARA